MRLKADVIRVIKEEAKAVFGASAIIRLFGSRMEDNLKGGDIDLFLEVEPDRKNLKKEIE